MAPDLLLHLSPKNWHGLWKCTFQWYRSEIGYANTYISGWPGFHKWVANIMKLSHKKWPAHMIKYREYKKLLNERFRKSLNESLANNPFWINYFLRRSLEKEWIGQIKMYLWMTKFRKQ